MRLVKSLCRALLVKGFFENNISSLLSCNSEGTFKKILLYLENYMIRPEVGAPNAISKQEMQAISRYAKERNIEISPLVQIGRAHV